MIVKQIKNLVDACYEAKRIRELLPPLPQGVAPSYIHFLDVIGQAERRGEKAKVSDISTALHIPLPGVTRTLKEMEAKGYVEKKASAEDGRVTYLVFGMVGYFNGHNKTVWVMVQGLIQTLLVRLPMAYFMSIQENASLTKIGLAAPVSTAVGVLLNLVFSGI